MKCKDCRNWQGCKGAEWGDCNRVVAALEPRLLDCYKTNDEGMIVEFWGVPFDPHEVKYWSNHQEFCELYKTVGDEIPFLGVKLQKNEREDLLFDNNGGEKLGNITYKHFQTHKDFECPLEEE